MSSQTEEESVKKMLERVGIIAKKSSLDKQNFYDAMFTFLSRFALASMEEENPLIKRIESLEKTVGRLKEEKERKKIHLKADLVYLKFKDELEEKYFGKIVAIDVESEGIAGIGNSIKDAYREARKNTSKKRFSYRRVGFDFVHRI